MLFSEWKPSKRSIVLASTVLGVFIIGVFVFFALKVGRPVPSIDLTRAQGKKNLVHVAIIGSGPAGLSAALYAARFKRNTVVFEGEKPGGLLTETSVVENWPGFTLIKGPELIKRMRHQAKAAGALFAKDTITHVNLSVWPFELGTARGNRIHALSLIIASGAVPRSLDIPGESAFWGRGVTSCAKCDAPFFKDKRVMVVGGGDSAIEQAMQLAQYAKQVMIMVRKPYFKAGPVMQEYLRQYPNVVVRHEVELKAIHGNVAGVTAVSVYEHRTRAEKEEPIDGVFLAIGHEPNVSLFKGILPTDSAGYLVREPHSARTAVNGVFVAGEVTDNYYRQAIVAAGDGVCAAIDANAFLSSIGVTPMFDTSVQQWWYGAYRTSITLVKSMADLYAVLDAASVPVFVYFYDESCPVCSEFDVLYEKAVREYDHRALFVRVDVTLSEDIVRAYHVPRVPAIRIFSGRTLVGQYTGALSSEVWQQLLENALGGAVQDR